MIRTRNLSPVVCALVLFFLCNIGCVSLASVYVYTRIPRMYPLQPTPVCSPSFVRLWLFPYPLLSPIVIQRLRR